LLVKSLSPDVAFFRAPEPYWQCWQVIKARPKLLGNQSNLTGKKASLLTSNPSATDGSFTSRHAGIAVAGIALRQSVIEADRVAVLNLLAVNANRLQQHDGLGRRAGYAVPVIRRLRVDWPAAREPEVEALGSQKSKRIFPTGMQAARI
jgi:hypothetical protein